MNFKRHRSTGEMLTRGYGEARDSVHTLTSRETQKHGRNGEERTWRRKGFSSHYNFKRHSGTGEIQTRGYGEGRDLVCTITSRDTEAREKCRQGGMERAESSVHTFTSRDTKAREKCRQGGMERGGIEFTLSLQETQKNGRNGEEMVWRGEGIQFTRSLQETQKHGRNADKRAWRGKRFSSHLNFKRHRSTGEMQTRGHGEGRDSVHI